MGGHLNAYTSREQTCYYAKVGHVAADAGLKLHCMSKARKNDVQSGGQALPELSAAYMKRMC